MNKNKTRALVESSIVAALYVVLTLVSKPLTIGFVEIRFSEVLTVLPYFMPSTVWGLFAGCFIANVFSGSLVDVLIGSLATLIGAYLTSKIKIKWLCPLPTVISNTLLIPLVIMTYASTWSPSAYFLAAGGVFASEFVSVYILGLILLLVLEKRKIFKR